MGPAHSSLARCSFFCLACLLPTQFPRAGAQSPQETPLYKQATAPIEARIKDLLRMTVEEKARQLDMYSAARYIVDKHTDDTHAALDAVLPAFREGHAMATMAVYHEIDGIPVTADPLLLKTILRQEWGFQGFVLSDLGAIERLYTVHHVAASPKDASCLAIRSGVDMQFYDFPHDVFQKALVDCVREGSLPQSDLDRAVRSVLRVKFALGLFSVSVGGSSEASLTAEFRL
jgi:hypothetical protein